MSKINKKKFDPTLNFWLLAVTTLIVFFSISVIFVFLSKTSQRLNQKIAEAKEAARPAEISLTIINDSACPDCVSLQPLLNNIKSANVKIAAEETIEAVSDKGKGLISKYKILKLPSLVVVGEIKKEKTLEEMWSKLGEIKDNAFVLTQVGAPYVLVGSGEVRGRVELTMLTDRDCKNCYDVTTHESILRVYGIPAGKQKIVEANLADGRSLINKYQIKLLPTIILAGDLEAYPALKSVWSSVGTIEKDGAYVFRNGVKQMGVYKDLIANKIIDPRIKKQQ